jgi:hypothetical protein
MFEGSRLGIQWANPCGGLIDVHLRLAEIAPAALVTAAAVAVVSMIGAARVKVVQEKREGEGKERVGVSVDSGKQNAEGSAEIVRTAVPQSIAESREAH